MTCDEATLRSRFTGSRLCHGSTSTLGAKILETRELRNRALTGVPVTKRTGRRYLDSDPNMVYLATLPAPLYASDLAIQERGAGEITACPCMVEVDAAQLIFENFFPDEDYVGRRLWAAEQGVQIETIPSKLHERRLAELQALAKSQPEARRDWVCDSLDTLGSVAYRGIIPLSAITRITVMDDPDGFSFLSTAIDAMASYGGFGLNALERQLYPLLTRWLLGDAVSPNEFPSLMRQTDGQKALLTKRMAIRPKVLYARPMQA